MSGITKIERIRRTGVSEQLLLSPNMHYTCTVCEISKPMTEFHPDKNTSTGLRSECKECHRATMRTPENRLRSKLYNREMRKKDIRVYMCYGAKMRAKKAGVPFSITKENIHIPERCPILGTLLQVGVGQMTDNSPSLDRTIPELGYVPGNIAVISYRANRIKNVANIDEIAKIINYVKTFGKESIKKEVTCSENQQVKINNQITEVSK